MTDNHSPRELKHSLPHARSADLVGPLPAHRAYRPEGRSFGAETMEARVPLARMPAFAVLLG
jgi:hypothetical protein